MSQVTKNNRVLEEKQAPYDYVDSVGLEYTLRKLYTALSAEWVKKEEGIDADKITYDNSTSELEAENIQSAIDELANSKIDKEDGKVLSSNDFTDELKDKLDKIADEATKIILDTVLADSENGITNKAVFDEFAKVAYLTGAEFIGSVKVPTAAASSNDTTVATTAFVSTAITNALSDIAGIKFDGPYDTYADLLEKVPTGVAGTIYLVKNSGSAPNVSDEYFWKDDHYELFGTTAIDTSVFVKKEDMYAISTTEIDKMLTDAGFKIQVTS